MSGAHERLDFGPVEAWGRFWWEGALFPAIQYHSDNMVHGFSLKA